jgi:acyl-[acyl carrier protein]--UDP-N-acetylglucosamine O-acyltransferase
MPQLGLIAIMAAMSDDVPPLSGAGGVREIARFLNTHHCGLNDEQAAELMLLGAALWRRSVELDDTVPEIEMQLAQRQ